MGATAMGLIASLGAFASRFPAQRPYVNRGVGLAVIVISLAGAVALGDWAAQWPWFSVAVVTAVAVVAIWLCNALSVGPPGGYVFVVACAAGVGISGANLDPWTTGLLVLCGGTFAWLVQMADIVTGFRAPERQAVAAAGEAVAAYIEASNSTSRDCTHEGDSGGVQDGQAVRHRAATALHRSWNVLITYQPIRVPANSVVHQLRNANHALHVLFTSVASGSTTEDAGAARRIAALEQAPETVAVRNPNRIHLPGPPIWRLLAGAISPGSPARHIMLRVAIAGPAAGVLAILLGLGHPYWAMSTAVLLLHQGIDRTKTLRRSVELLVGTWLGLGLAGGILVLHPHGLWLAGTVTVLQFTIMMLAPRNYTVAAIFIAAIALTISSGTHPVDIGPLLIARGLDVFIGCAVAIPVYLITAHFQEATRVPDAIVKTLDLAAVMIGYLAAGDWASIPARGARRNLQLALITLRESDESAQAGSPQQRSRAGEMEPAVAATERLAYRTIAACWALEHRPDPVAFTRQLFEPHSADDYIGALRELAAAVRTGSAPTTIPDPTATMESTAFLAEEIAALRLSMQPNG
jgi:uncharacterized membrane protein YccC